MFATAHIGPSLDFSGFMQDVECVTAMSTAIRELHQLITQAMRNVRRDMLQPLEYADGIQGQT
jgi:hypothetical protein